MSHGALTVQPDGTLRVEPHPDEDTAALEATLASFADLVCPTAEPRVYRLTAASIWRARRAGLAREEILQTLETSSSMALPSTVRADIARWSHQIDRLTLETDQGCLLLRSPHPLVLTAVRRHRTLGAFITHQCDTTTVALRTDAYPELVHTFDACGYPVLDRVPAGWQPDAAPALPAARSARPVVQPLPVQTGRRRAARVEGLRRLPRQCQATTQAGRPCKNRAQPTSGFCWVHAAWSPQVRSQAPYTPHVRLASPFLEGRLASELMALPQLAVYRVTVLMGIGLLTWLLLLLLRQLGGDALSLSLPPWGRCRAGVGGHLRTRRAPGSRAGPGSECPPGATPRDLGGARLSAQRRADPQSVFCGDPVVLPAVVLSHMALSLGWVFVCFPVGIVLGLFCYIFLDAMSA
jgi:hypothetical protein